MYANQETLWRTTISRNPDAFMPHNNLGSVLFGQSRLNEAMFHFQEALRLKPDNEVAYHNVGYVLVHKGQLDDAIVQFRKSLEIAPNYPRAHINIANVFMIKGQVREAIAHYRSAWEARPNNADTAYKLAWLLATYPDHTLRNGPKAIELAQHADWLSGRKNPVFIAALAAAYAESGRFSQAITTAKRALELARSQGNEAMVDALVTQIALYEAGIPFRDSSRMKAPTPAE